MCAGTEGRGRAREDLPLSQVPLNSGGTGEHASGLDWPVPLARVSPATNPLGHRCDIFRPIRIVLWHPPWLLSGLHRGNKPDYMSEGASLRVHATKCGRSRAITIRYTYTGSLP